MEVEVARLGYLENGFDSIPLRPLSKLPLARAWQVKPTFRQWYNAPTDSNIGLRAGNGRAFLDCDDKNQPDTFSNVINWLEGLGHKEEDLPIVQTASGVGRHVYVNFSGAMLGSRRNFVTQMGVGDFRFGPASFVTAPPSAVEQGEYRLLQGSLSNLPSLDLHDIATLINLNEVVREETPKPRMSALARAIASGQEVKRHQSGQEVKRYQSRSEAERALILSLINTGFDFSGIKAIFDSFPCAGCYSEKHKADGWLYMNYQDALNFSHKESPIRRLILEFQEAARQAAWKNASDKNLLLAHASKAYKAAKMDYSASVRDLALASGTSTRTASDATKRLVKEGFIALVAPGTATLANSYSLQVSKVKHFLSTPMSGSVTVWTLPREEWQALATHDAFRNGYGKKKRLGQRAGQIYQSLSQKPQTVSELQTSTGASKNTIKRALRKMSMVKDRATGEVIAMVSVEGDTWTANLVDLNQIAAIYETYGATGKQREVFARESREHARSLEIGAAEMQAISKESREDDRERRDLWNMGHGG